MLKLLVKSWVNSGDLMFSMATIANDPVFYT